MTDANAERAWKHFMHAHVAGRPLWVLIAESAVDPFEVKAAFVTALKAASDD